MRLNTLIVVLVVAVAAASTTVLANCGACGGHAKEATEKKACACGKADHSKCKAAATNETAKVEAKAE